MHSILIVDDERIERRGIKSLLEKIEVELDIKETSNGKEALEYLIKNRVDILLTDIKMPFMDGIELIENLKKNDIKLKIVIFSGYEEFEYAKFATKMGVQDYILKPVDPNEFKETIIRIINEIKKESDENHKKIKNISFIKEQLLHYLINGMPLEEVEKRVEDIIDLSSLKSFNRLLLIDFNKNIKNEDEVKLRSIIRIHMDGLYEYLNLNSQHILLIFKQNYRDMNGSYNFAMKIHDHILRELNINCYISISDELEDIKKISQCYKKLELLLEKKFYDTKNYIFIENGSNNDNMVIKIDDDIVIKQIRQDIKMKNINSIKKQFNYLCEKYSQEEDFSTTYIKFIFSSLIKEFFKSLPQVNEKQLKDDIDKMYKSKDFLSVINITNTYIKGIEEVFSDNPVMVHREIESIKQYIYENYSEDLSVEQLADRVCLAPNYLSYIFKKETGENLSKFIKTYRMTKAKEMLDNTYEKIVNISNSVGYQNVSYFCQSFREYFGVSPQKYRDKGESYEEND